MTVYLEALTFNHTSERIDNNALNLREDADEFVTIPEWIAIKHKLIRDVQPAAYAIEETGKARKITVKVKLSSTKSGKHSIKVRALDATPKPTLPPAEMGPWMQRGMFRPAYLLYALMSAVASAVRTITGIRILPPPNVLGEVEPQQITLDGQPVEKLFKLKNVRIWGAEVGVGVHTVRWKWQYWENKKSGWQDIITTEHKIYTILKAPGKPWQESPHATSNYYLPWTKVLDLACVWAREARTPEEAASAVTTHTYNLGPHYVRYGTLTGAGLFTGSETRSDGTDFDYFNCTLFLAILEHLKPKRPKVTRRKKQPGGGVHRGIFGNEERTSTTMDMFPAGVDCYDCAAIVTFFANILGCELTESGMWRFHDNVLSRWETNDICLIGWQEQGKPKWSSQVWAQHAVAWTGNLLRSDGLYDACLMLPHAPWNNTIAQNPILARNMPYGKKGDHHYLDRLVKEQYQDHVTPHGGEIRRELY